MRQCHLIQIPKDCKESGPVPSLLPSPTHYVFLRSCFHFSPLPELNACLLYLHNSKQNLQNSVYKIELTIQFKIEIWTCHIKTHFSTFFPLYPKYQNNNNRASLVAQWLRICLPMQGTRVRALVWEDPTRRGATRPMSHNYWACASGACAPQQERPR